MYITLIVSSLACGGAERAVVLIAEGLIKRGHKVSLLTIAGIEGDFYKVAKGVERIPLDLEKNSPTMLHALWNNLHRFWKVRRTISSLNPDIVISHMCESNILTLISLFNTKYSVIVTEQNDPRMARNQGIWGKLRRLIYPLAAKVVSVSQGVDSYFDWLPKTKRAVIYNPLQPISFEDEQDTINLPKGADPDKKWIIGMGRLEYQKNFELLISAFHKLADKYSDWQLLIFGEGTLRTKLEKMILSFGLTDRVLLLGVTSNPISILKKSELFVLSSRFEGLPLVLLEALACGLAVISTDCPSGPSEVIQGGINGILVPSENICKLAQIMDYLMSNDEERHNLSRQARITSKRFDLALVTEQWELLFHQVAT